MSTLIRIEETLVNRNHVVTIRHDEYGTGGSVIGFTNGDTLRVTAFDPDEVHFKLFVSPESPNMDPAKFRSVAEKAARQIN